MAERERAVEAVGLSAPFAGRYAGCRVLVTGHTGFKGSWLALWLQQMGAEVCGLALDPEPGPSHWQALGMTLAMDARVDLRDAAGVQAVVSGFRPTLVLHLAARALVRRSYREPSDTYEVNVGGLVNLLEAVRGCDSVRAVVNATTDKVYEAPCPATGYAEDHPLGGHDPYSSSKACAEIVSSSYRRSYFRAEDVGLRNVGLATARAGNVIGGGDWAEDRLVPDLVRAAVAGAPLALRNPRSTRPWQHVLEPLSGYLDLGARLLSGEPVDEAWNFGPSPDAALEVGEVAQQMRAQWPGLQITQDSGPHPHEAPMLTLDCRKAAQRLGWRPVWDADATLQRTLRWYRAHASRGEILTKQDIDAYVADARGARLGWAG